MNGQLGTAVISITPFDERGRLDEPAFRAHLRRLRDAGLGVYLAGGASGEGHALKPDERDRILAIGVEELKGRVPVRAGGCEPHVTEEMVEFLQSAERHKVDAAQILSLEMGHGSKPSPAEMEKYYFSTVGATSLPIYISSHEASGYLVPAELIERLIKRFSNIVGVTVGRSSTAYLAEVIERVGEQIEVYCAGPPNVLSVLGLGGNGFMCYESNLVPTLAPSIISAFYAKDFDGVRIGYRKLIALHRLLGRYGGTPLGALKPLMNSFGLQGGYLRQPRLPISDHDLGGLLIAVAKLDLPGLPAIAT